MNKLRKSPFKLDKIEKNPTGFGLRIKQITECFQNLYNNRSLIISGPRGIGKSSLGVQLQNVFAGDNTLLKRCYINEEFPNSVCIYKACSKQDTLDQITLDILSDLENEVKNLQLNFNCKLNACLEFNFGPIKAQINAEKDKKEYLPSTMANILANSLIKTICTFNKDNLNLGINIMLDEMDQLNRDINFGHFIKVVNETLNNKGVENITFIVAGQTGIFNRFNNEDRSFERIVKHIPISPLDEEACEYILLYAQDKAKPPFTIQQNAKKMILSLASGYPYVIHLIGDAAFFKMKNEKTMTSIDVLSGIENILQSNKKEKYIEKLKHINPFERKVIITLSQYHSNEIPVKIPINWILDRLLNKNNSIDKIQSCLECLVEKGYLKVKSTPPNNNKLYYFAEELFRVFVSLKRIEKYEVDVNRRYKDNENYYQANIDRPYQLDENSYNDQYFFEHEIDNELTYEINSTRIDEVMNELEEAEYDPDFEDTELDILYYDE